MAEELPQVGNIPRSKKAILPFFQAGRRNPILCHCFFLPFLHFIPLFAHFFRSVATNGLLPRPLLNHGTLGKAPLQFVENTKLC